MSTKIFKINRGDSFEFNIDIPDNDDATKNYILTSRDAVYFALLCPHQRFEDALILKGYTYGGDQDIETGKILIKLDPADTRYLEPGIYYYTVKLQRGGNIYTIGDLTNPPDEVRTIVERTKFIINE